MQPLYLHTYVRISISVATVLKEVLPSCVYQPIYAFPREVLRYTGWKELPYTANYPDDHTWQRNGRFTFEGNALIEQEVGLYTYVPKKHLFGLWKKRKKVGN